MLTFPDGLTRGSTISPPTISPPTIPAPDARSRRRVLQVLDDDRAGPARHVLDLARHLSADGWLVDLAYVPGASHEPRAVHDGLGQRFESLGVGDVLELTGDPSQALDRLRRLVADRHHTVVHGHGTRAATWALLAASSSGARTVHSPHDPGAAHRPQDGATTELSAFVDHVIHDVAPRATGRRGGSESVVAPGIDPRVLPQRVRVRAELGLAAYGRATDPLTIGWAGHLEHGHDLGVLLEACDRLPRLVDRGAEIVVLGDGPARAALQSAAAESGQAVRFVGDTDVARSMPALDLFVLPSDRGDHPFDLLEALWAGVPCVAASSPVTRALLGDGEAGMICDGTPEALASAIAEFFPRTRRLRASTAARARAAECTNRRMAAAIADVYATLLAGARERSAAATLS